MSNQKKNLCEFEHNGKRYVALVRKLTERECYRLMGVEDEQIDTMLSTDIARTAHYKLAGNAIVVDVLYHMFRKLFIEPSNDAAQLDLFDTMADTERPQYNHENPLRVVTLCSGFDTQCLAFERLKRDFPPFDYELVNWSEFDPISKTPLENQPAVKAHNALFPQWADRNLGDMTKIDWGKVPDFDCLFYSTPCVTRDMRVLTADGYKPIVDVKVGEKVLTKGGTWEKVAKKFDNGVHPTCFITYKGLDSDTSIHCTYNHKFYVLSKDSTEPEFKQAKDLVEGDFFLMVDNRAMFTFNGVHYATYPFTGRTDGNEEYVYNMEVENDHSYILEGIISKNCQSISQAGLQHGFTEGSGTRSSIIWNVRDALRIKQPKYACLENVAAMVSAKFLPMFNLWRNEVSRLGYNNFAQVLNAKHYGVPQNRDRIFLMSIRNDIAENYYFPEQMPLHHTLPQMLEDTVDTRYYLNPIKVNKFIEDNLVMIEKYMDSSDEPIEPLPDHLREFLAKAEAEGLDNAQNDLDNEEAPGNKVEVYPNE